MCAFPLAWAKQFSYLPEDLGRGKNFALHIEGKKKKENKKTKETRKSKKILWCPMSENLLSVYNTQQKPSLAKGGVILQLRI